MVCKMETDVYIQWKCDYVTNKSDSHTSLAVSHSVSILHNVLDFIVFQIFCLECYFSSVSFNFLMKKYEKVSFIKCYVIIDVMVDGWCHTIVAPIKTWIEAQEEPLFQTLFLYDNEFTEVKVKAVPRSWWDANVSWPYWASVAIHALCIGGLDLNSRINSGFHRIMGYRNCGTWF